MGFYGDMRIECVNKDTFYPWPSDKELDWAETVSCHVALTSFQLQRLGCRQKAIGKMVKRGVLHRYKVVTPEGSLPSIFTVGKSAGVIARLPRPRFPNMETLRSILMVNQVIVSIQDQSSAIVDVNPRRPVQIVTVNNPFGIFIAKDKHYAELPLRYGLTQAVVILPHRDLSINGLPFRYVLEEELGPNSFDIRYYAATQCGLIPKAIDFHKNETQPFIQSSMDELTDYKGGAQKSEKISEKPSESPGQRPEDCLSAYY